MKFDDVKKLTQKKYRQTFGYFLLEGEHLVLELQKALPANPLLRESELYVTDDYAKWQSPLKINVISDRHMAQITSTKTPQGIVAVVPLLNPRPPRTGERAIYLHEIQDPGNLGTVLRTLAWFGHFRCLLSPNSVDPYNDKAVRASMGGIFHVPIEIDVPLESLRTRFKYIACLDMNGQIIQSDQFKNYECYIFGNEARGLSPQAMDNVSAEKFTIPGADFIESLNVASAVNICIYEVMR